MEYDILWKLKYFTKKKYSYKVEINTKFCIV